MGTAASRNSSTKNVQTSLQSQCESVTKNKEIVQSSSNIPPSENIKTSNPKVKDTSNESNNNEEQSDGDKVEHVQKNEDKNENEKKTDEDKSTDEDNSTDVDTDTDTDTDTDEEMMTDKQLEEFRSETFNYIRLSVENVAELEAHYDQDGQFVTEVTEAMALFYDSYNSLKRTLRVNIETFWRDLAELMMETKFLSMCCEIVIYSCKKGWHLTVCDLEEDPYFLLYISMVTLLNLSDICDNFAVALAKEPEFVETVRQILQDIHPKYFAKEKESKLAESQDNVLEAAIGIVHNMSMRESNVSKLRNVGMIECLKPYLKAPNDMYALSALASLAGIIKEDECDIINSNKQIVIYLLDCTRRGMLEKMRRCGEGWSCTECGFTIKMLARNDANVKMLVELGALELLVELGRTGDEKEQYESVSALWALSFDEENQELITGKKELGVVDLFEDLKSSKNEEIKKACNGALWTLRDALKRTVVKTYKKIGELYDAVSDNIKKKDEGSQEFYTSNDQASSKGHVMISYQWGDQEVLKNVRDNIKAKGLKVWMDIDQMGGSTLQAMADAVEGADIFLMCMSNKYKHSPACRAEAEYAFQLRKYVIPLKMERGYTPDGWLGFIMGAKLFFDFSGKYPFEDKMKGLIKEIETVLGGALDMPDSGEIIKPQIASVSKSTVVHTVSHVDTASTPGNSVAKASFSKTTVDTVSKWTADDVKSWAERNGLQKSRISNLTGGEIAMLACMRVECPEFFYSCLQDMLKIKDLLTMSKIFLALHNLS